MSAQRNDTAADRALVARDPGLVGLGLVLDDRALSELVGEPVVVSRLRYKPGSSVVAAWSSADGGTRGWVGSYVAAVKIEKAVKIAGRTGVASTVSPDGTTVAVGALGDRALARTVVRLQREHPDLLERGRLVRHNPLRRQVWRTVDADGREVALRLFGGSGHDRAAAVRDLATLGLPVLVPEPLDDVAGAEIVPWWGRGDLSAHPSYEDAHAAGVVAARLHSSAPAGTVGRSGVDRSLVAVGTLLPGLDDQVEALRRAVPDVLPGSAPVPLHGDLSPDQVLVGPDGIRLIDFDRLQVGPRERDLGSFLAASDLLGLDELRDPFLAGYLQGGGRWNDHALTVWEGLCLLERATDPFRNRVAHWPGRTRLLLDRAGTRLGA